MTQPVLSLSSVSLAYGRTSTVEAVSFTVAPGESLALLGHNGAGKSTLFKAILGFLPLADGAIRIAGHAPGTDAARRAINYLPEVVTFPRSLTGHEILQYFSGLRGAPRREARALLERVGLADAADRAVGTYSKGMRQRLGLAQALIGAPRLLLLDEPTSGLDPVSRQDFYGVIAEAAARGSAVLLSSHGLEEIEHRTDRVAILSQGRLRAMGTLDDLAREAKLPTRLRVTAREGAADELQAEFGGRRLNGCRLDIDCAAGAKLGLVARLGADAGRVADIQMTPPTLNDVYLHFSNLDAEALP
ncbi:ABC transporter ATP-binding protein [Maritimibacter sp. DP1N21-5]|uniref:ABC transporter ATP-binding protein n=1 Tax=Maritimibacter sp. DP1N21-5 TaxID=2836867 RepID=UPI001C463D28|nr:ABC transporter ATP-binding protein [Maritimibacter sp. DP1N21-5]MBV7410076.1 ABC transporter ATP-binding protein [Maritimibacter sp. DP1N21-5]